MVFMFVAFFFPSLIGMSFAYCTSLHFLLLKGSRDLDFAMQDDEAKCNIKLITILSLTALATILAFLAAIPLCGFQGLDRQAGTSQNNPSYFWRKFEKEPKVVFGARLFSVALAACCLFGQNIIVVRSYCRQKELKQNSPNINITCSQGQINSCYIFTSLTVLFLLPASVFYLLLNFEKSAQYAWLLACLGIMTLILVIIVLGIFIHLAVHSRNEELPKAESAMDECEKMQEIFTMKVPQMGLKKEEFNGDMKSAFDVQGAAQIYETIKIYKQSQQKRNEMPIPNSGIPLYAQLFSQFQQPKKVNESAKKEKEALKKNTLLAEIQRRKKKFREVNPLKEYVIEERSQEESQEIDDQNHPKLTNLPKSYRQYIKESKRPSRKIALKPVVSQASISAEEKINNKLQSVEHEWSQRAKAHFTKEAATSKEGELVYQKKTKPKKRQRKVLFDEYGAIVGENATEQTEQNEDQLAKKKHIKKDLSREDNLLQILKRKYSEGQQ